VRTAPNKFIISFDKHLVDEEIFAQFFEQSKLNFIPKENKKNNVPDNKIEEENNPKSKLYLAAQRFKGFAANSEYICSNKQVAERLALAQQFKGIVKNSTYETSKYDVCEQ